MINKIRSEVADEFEQAMNDAKDDTSEQASSKSEINKRVLQTLRAKIQMVKTIPSVICHRRTHAAPQESMGNAILDNGADSTLLGSAFRMLEYTDRLASIVGFDQNLVIEDKKIGTGLAAFDHLLPKEQYIPVSVKIKQNGTLIIVSTGGYHYQPEEEMEQIPLRSQQVNITEETKMRFLNAVKRGEGSIVADGSYKAGRSSAAIVVQHEKSDIKSEN